MTDRPWIAHYVAGTRPEIDRLPYSSLAEFARRGAEKYAEKVAFAQCMPNGMTASLTYAQVDRLSDHFAAYLREVAGLLDGDRVAVQMPNCLAYPVAAIGTWKAGGVLVNTNPLYTPPEMAHQFSDSGAKVLVILDMFADRLPPVLPKTPQLEHVVIASIAEFFPFPRSALVKLVLKYVKKQVPPVTVAHTTFGAAMKAGAGAVGRADFDRYVSAVSLQSPAALQYTGGTTGVSKGAELSHGNLLANTMQLAEVSRKFLRNGQETVLTALPLYHIFALTVNFLLFYEIGGQDVLVPSPRPPSNLKAAFEKFPVTWMTGVNTLFNALLNEEWFRQNPPKHLVTSLAGGMALHSAVAKRWQEVTGTPVVEGYGLTETSPVATFNPIGGVVKDGIGVPLPSTDVRCVDEAGAPVPVGQPGELVIRGPQVMLGYWGRPEETAKVLGEDGWLRTGDIAVMDEDGYFKIVDRKKDMILVSGFNVYPNEVEDCIAKHPGVAEVAVIGVPDEKTGEAVQAYIVKKDPDLTAEAVIAHARAELTNYKVPRQVVFRDDLPKSPVGKILRKDLRAELMSASPSKQGAGV